LFIEEVVITALHSRKEHRLGGGSHTTHEALSLIILIVQVPSYFTDSFIKKQKKPFIPPQIWDERIFYIAPSNQEKRKKKTISSGKLLSSKTKFYTM